MKLDSEKEVLLCQKALYAKQLINYSDLCSIYQDLANIAVEQRRFAIRPNISIANQVQEYYGKYLTMVSKGDFSFLDGHHDFDENQLRLFKKYYRSVNRVALFREASEKLHEATYYNDNFDISPELMEEYHEFMQSYKETRSFEQFIAENPKRWIGHIYYQQSIAEIDKIEKIDPNHLAVLSRKTISPKSFGATISGARGRITPIRDRLENEFATSYTASEHDEYSKDISIPEALGAAAYRTGYNIKEAAKSTYTAHKGTIQKAAKKAAVIALSIGVVTGAIKGAESLGNAMEYNNLSAYTNPESGYVQTIDDDTMQTLRRTDELIESLENSPTTPTKDELHELRDAVDDEINIVIDDLVRSSFSEKYPNLTIPEGGVVVHYNDAHINPEDGKDGNYIFVKCEDINGKSYEFRIENFASQGENHLKDAYGEKEGERAADALKSLINASSSGNYQKNTLTVTEVIEIIKRIHNNTLNLAGTAFDVNIPAAEYASKSAVNQETVLDFVKKALAEASVVSEIPEKDPTYIAPSTNENPTHASVEHDDDER